MSQSCFFNRIIQVTSYFLLFAISITTSRITNADALHQLRLNRSVISSLLNQKTVKAVNRDDDGFLWIGTQQGLYRYDGIRVSTFSPRNRDKFWVPNSDIRQIEIGSNGDLWIATLGGGVAKYDWRKESFSPIFSDTINDNMFVTSMLDTNDGNIWFGTRDSGIGMYSILENRHATWLKAHPLNLQITQPSDMIEHPSGNIWVGSATGLYLVEPSIQRITSYASDIPGSLANSSISVKAVELDSNNLLWVGTESGRILQFDIDTRKFISIDGFSKLQFGSIKDLSMDNDQLWVATDQGLHVLDTRSLEVTKFAKRNSALSNDHVTNLFQDRNILWVGTYAGLNVVSKSAFDAFNLENSDVANEVLSFSQDHEERLWVGTYNGLYFMDQNSRVHKPSSSFSPKLLTDDPRVMSVAVKGHQLWTGFRHDGVQIINLTDGTSRKLAFPGNSNLGITKILHQSDCQTWIGTYNNGLYRVIDEAAISLYSDDDTGSFTLSEKSITALMENQAGDILIGTEGGIFRYDSSAKSFSPITLEYENRIISPVILSIAQSENGNIWVGTKDHGVFLRSRSTEQKYLNLDHFNSRLSGITAYAIEFDGAEHAWISTTKGLLEISKNGELLKSYSRADGLQGNDFNFGASHKDSNGLLYFGGSNGYNRFDPSKIEIDSPPPPVVLTSLNIAGREPRLPVALQDLELIELSHKDYFITLIFSALDFLDPSKNQYSYKLEGFDPEWITNDTRNSATYTNLPAGEYLFRVRGANSAGVWNLEGASVKIRVLPAPWMTWWAFLGYAMVLLGIIYFSRRTYDSRLLAKSEAARADEMRDAADRANDDLQEQLEIQDQLVNAVYRHNVDTLDLVRNFIVIQSDFFDDELMSEAMQSNQKRLLALGLLERCVFYQGDKLFADMSGYVDLLIELVLTSSPIPVESITTVNEMGDRLVPLEIASPLAIICYELLLNCVLHAFEDAGPANYIRISMDAAISDDDSGSQTLSVTVKDNGVGIPDAISSDGTDSAGLAIVNMVVNQLGGQLAIAGNDGTKVVAILPDSPRLLPPYGGLQKFHP